MRGACQTYAVPKHQADAVLNQAAPVSGTKYVVLDTTKNARILSIMVQCTWTVQPDPLEVHVTIDSQNLTRGETNPVSTTYYYVAIQGNIPLILITTAGTSHSRAFLLEGRSVKIEVEITGGTVSNLSATVKYAKW